MSTVGLTTRIGRRVLMLPCDCSAADDYIRLSFWLDSFEDFPVLEVSVMAPRRSGWRERLKMIWEILRGRSPWFSSIILDRPGVIQASEFLKEWVLWAEGWEMEQKTEEVQELGPGPQYV